MFLPYGGACVAKETYLGESLETTCVRDMLCDEGPAAKPPLIGSGVNGRGQGV